MTIGIYALYWEEQDLIYIGQSSNIEQRLKQHVNLLTKNKHHNYKVQSAYNIQSEFNKIIIEECLLEHLNEREIYWTKELDTLNTFHGLNIIEAGGNGWGINSAHSKYSKIQILRVFRLLSGTSTYSLEEISSCTGVMAPLISNIKGGVAHTWLKEAYPVKYSLMLLKAFSRDPSIKHSPLDTTKVRIIDPIGNVHLVKCIRSFAISYNLNYSHLSELLRGKRKTHKGWKLYTPSILEESKCQA